MAVRQLSDMCLSLRHCAQRRVQAQVKIAVAPHVAGYATQPRAREFHGSAAGADPRPVVRAGVLPIMLATIPAAANLYSASVGMTIASAHSIRSRFLGGDPAPGGNILVQHPTVRRRCWA